MKVKPFLFSLPILSEGRTFKFDRPVVEEYNNNNKNRCHGIIRRVQNFFEPPHNTKRACFQPAGESKSVAAKYWHQREECDHIQLPGYGCLFLLV